MLEFKGKYRITAKKFGIKHEIQQEILTMRQFRIWVIVLFIIGNLLSLLQPYLLGRIVDNLLNPSSTIYILGAILIGLLIGAFVFDWFQNYMWFKMIIKGTSLARGKVFSRLIGKNDPDIHKKSNGDLVNRVINDTAQYAEQLLISWPMILLNSSTLVIIFGFLFYMNAPMALMIVGFSIAYFFAYLRLNRKIRNNTKKEREGFSNVMQSAQNILSGASDIQRFNSGSFFGRKFSNVVNQHYHFLMGLQKWKSLGQSITNFLLNSMPVATVLLGAYFLVQKDITVGVIFSFYSYLPFLSEPIRNLTDVNLSLQQAKAVESRLEELLPSSDEQEGQMLLTLGRLEQLSFQQVSFFYEESVPILNNLSFVLNAGSRLAITGSSGSGKSTSLKLLLGQISPDKGNIKLNGNSFVNWDKRSYLNRVAVLPQDVFLFDGSIEENVHFGRDFTETEMSEALALSNYNFLVEKSSKGISGGERQRVGLARSLLKQVDLLILDEPTSELDMNMERIIVENLDQYLKKSGAMLVVVSHRPEILRICTSELILFKNGQWEIKELQSILPNSMETC